MTRLMASELLLRDIERNTKQALLERSTDRSGEPLRNARLAIQRIESASRVLQENGIKPYRIFRVPLSEVAAPVPTADGIREPENRAVQVWIL